MSNNFNAHFHMGTLILLLPIVSTSLVITSGCSNGQANEKIESAGVVFLDAMSIFGSRERPPIAFPHDLHTTVLEARNKDCETCHLRINENRLSQKFLRLTDGSKDEMMELYHTNCINCHTEIARTGAKSGPVICGGCHSEESFYVSIHEPMGFDKFLHHRHVESNKEDCGLCHHKYDEREKKIYYAKGEESSCRDCHQEKLVDNVKSISEAVHLACLGCHLQREDAGPVHCDGCHSKERQMAYEKVEKPMRFKRNQPDFLLVSAADTELTSSKLNAVPFSHIDHETYTTTCRGCHHNTLKACTECHSLRGSAEGKGVNLRQAFHEMRSGYSCIGCHEAQKSEIRCSGCHSLMEHGELSEHACMICHTGPQPEMLEKVRDKYTSLDQFKLRRSEDGIMFKEEDLPDSVVISILSEKYEPAVFPHQRVLNRLMKEIGSSRIAVHFHGHEDVVCQGCHHNSPRGIKPPLCESCHGEPFNEAYLLRPGLMGAYHQQCIGCHQAMKIKQPFDCTLCHAEKKLAE